MQPASPWARPRLSPPTCSAASSRPITPRTLTAATTSSTGKKLEQKYYRTHSGYPGGLKETQYKTLMQKKPELAMRLAVRGMLQKNTIAQWQLKRLRIFPGAEHTHAAQKPEVWDR